MRLGKLLAFLRTQLFLLLLTLAGVELVLHALDVSSLIVRRLLAPPWIVDAPVVADEQQVFHGNPLRPDVDSRGYRNARAVTQAGHILKQLEKTNNLDHRGKLLSMFYDVMEQLR